MTIGGAAFAHLLFVLRLSYSRWTWVCLAFGETFEATVAGLQGALWSLGGVPEVVRHDNLSAATHELKKSGGRSLTRRFKDVLEHYDTRSTRINPGESHENGVVEKANDLVKEALDQALRLRGSREFATVDEYRLFVEQIVERDINRSAAEKLELERRQLKPLPAAPVPAYTVYEPTVRRWSTIRVGGRLYSVPSRLIGHKLRALQHPDVVEVYYGDQLVETMPRLRGEGEVRIDYRHVVRSLVRKPGAFARYKFREELFPTLTFRRAYDALQRWRGDRGADIEYVRILHLAATTMQSQVEEALALLLEAGARFDYMEVKELAAPEPREVPHIAIAEPNLANYDRLLRSAR